MEKIFSERAWDDYLYWQNSDKKKLARINKLIQDIERTPYEGTGKPEPLKYKYTGYWSRRIDEEHRVVYKISESGDTLLIAQLRYHY